MFCPKCNQQMGKVWATPYGKMTLHKLPDVEYCFKCMNLYTAVPAPLLLKQIQSSKEKVN